jgi:ATP-dependent Clp protease ATP-binding subunit ClpA
MAVSELAARVAAASGGRLELQPHSGLIDLAVQGSLKTPQYGARGVQRAVQRKIAVPLSKCALWFSLVQIGLATSLSERSH